MTKIKELIFGVRTKPVETFSTGFKSCYPKERLSYQQWCEEFRVSMLHDKKITHLEKEKK